MEVSVVVDALSTLLDSMRGGIGRSNSNVGCIGCGELVADEISWASVLIEGNGGKKSGIWSGGCQSALRGRFRGCEGGEEFDTGEGGNGGVNIRGDTVTGGGADASMSILSVLTKPGLASVLVCSNSRSESSSSSVVFES